MGVKLSFYDTIFVPWVDFNSNLVFLLLTWWYYVVNWQKFEKMVTQINNFESKMDNFESKMDNFGSKMNNFELKIKNFESKRYSKSTMSGIFDYF